MTIIRQFNDYVCYRIARKYFKKDGVSSDRAIITLAFFYSLNVWNLAAVCVRLFFNRQQTSQYVTESKVIGMLILVGLYFLFWRHYKDRYLELRERYGSEPRPKKIVNGILMMVVLLTPLLIAILLGFRK